MAGKSKQTAAKTTPKPTKTAKAKTEPAETKTKTVTKLETVKAKNETETVKTETPIQTNNQSVIIAVLVTILICFVLVFGILLATGVIKFGNNDKNTPNSDGTRQIQLDSRDKTPGSTDTSKIIDNPNPKVTIKDATLASVKDLEFYLPDDFEAGGKNKDGAYTYNLVDDDGWAQVLVYAEKSNLSPKQYLLKIGPYLDITDDDYEMNGTEWVQGENGSALAYATELDGVIYAVYYSVKLDSDATSEAMQMIPKTLYMKRIYAD